MACRADRDGRSAIQAHGTQAMHTGKGMPLRDSGPIFMVPSLSRIRLRNFWESALNFFEKILGNSVTNLILLQGQYRRVRVPSPLWSLLASQALCCNWCKATLGIVRFRGRDQVLGLSSSGADRSIRRPPGLVLLAWEALAACDCTHDAFQDFQACTFFCALCALRSTYDSLRGSFRDLHSSTPFRMRGTASAGRLFCRYFC